MIQCTSDIPGDLKGQSRIFSIIFRWYGTLWCFLKAKTDQSSRDKPYLLGIEGYGVTSTGDTQQQNTTKHEPYVWRTVYPKKYAHGFVVLCFDVVMQSFIMNSHEVFIHIHQGCFAGTGAIVRLPQCQWSKPDGYGKISQCITTTKHSKANTVCIFLGIYCTVFKIVEYTRVWGLG